MLNGHIFHVSSNCSGQKKHCLLTGLVIGDSSVWQVENNCAIDKIFERKKILYLFNTSVVFMISYATAHKNIRKKIKHKRCHFALNIFLVHKMVCSPIFVMVSLPVLVTHFYYAFILHKYWRQCAMRCSVVQCNAVAVIILVIDYDSVDCILLAINYAIKIHDHNNDNA